MKTVRLALAQYSLDPFENFDFWKKKQADWVKEAVKNQAQVLVFPEYGSMELACLLPKGLSLQEQIDQMQGFLPELLSHYRSLAEAHQVAILAPSFPVIERKFSRPVNRAFFISPSGEVDFQDKLKMTRFEDESWGVGSGDPTLKVFTAFGVRFGVAICFDVEFPKNPHLLARKEIEILLAPSCTETLHGLNRVHIGARARALENQFYVAVSQTVGEAPWSEAIDINTGRAALYTPCDLNFPEDGIQSIGKLQEPGWVYASVDVSKLAVVRKNGSVLNYHWMEKEN